MDGWGLVFIYSVDFLSSLSFPFFNFFFQQCYVHMNCEFYVSERKHYDELCVSV